MNYKTMNRKTFWLVAGVLLAMLPLSLGYVQAQITGYIPVFVDELGTEDISVIFQSVDGNIGIGTTTPAVKLHVIGNRIRLENAGKVIDLRADGAAVDLQSFTSSLFLRSNGPGGNNNIIMQPFPGDGDGNVGIGTTSPGSQLDVITSGTIAVRGRSSSTGACAVDGVAAATTGTADGVRGQTNSPSGRGVVAVSAGSSAANLGLQVFGRGRATGGFATGSGAFETDNPLDPANKYLRHAFVGSPDMKNIYDGVVVLDANGEALVDLPEWFEAINRDFRYQLTCIGGFAPVYVAEKISGNRFKISGGQPGLEVSWQVSGIRKDPYAEKYRIQVEEEKPATEKGLYLHPDVYGQPQTKSVQ